MKLLTIILCFLISIQALSQIETFNKYSYLIARFNNDKPISWGTCFFARFNNNLYLISCYHVFTGMDVFNAKRTDKGWNNIKVKVETGFVTIDINVDTLKASTKEFYFYDCPDLFIYKLNSHYYNKHFNSIEKHISSYSKNNGQPDTVFCFGFATHQGTYVANDLLKFSLSSYSGRLLNFGSNVNHTAYQKNNDTLTLIIKPYPLEGMSGAPLFFKFSNKITFGGVVFGQSSNNTYGYVVRPEEIIKRLTPSPARYFK